MITETFCNLYFNVANFIIGLLPTIETNSIGSISDMVVKIMAVNTFCPVYALGAGIGVLVIVNTVKLVMSLTNYIIRKIPTES